MWSGYSLLPSPEHVGGRVSNVRLRKPGDESISRGVLAFHCLFEHECSDALVITSNMGTVLIDRCSVDGKPSQYPYVLSIRFPLESKDGHFLVDFIGILCSFGSRVGKIGV